MKSLLPVMAFCLFALVSVGRAQAFEAGMTTLQIPEKDGQRALEGLLWYPTDATGPLSPDVVSKVWLSNLVVKEAESAPGPFPLVVLSHGMYGNALNQAWLAAALARKGFVVAAISHPGTSTWSRDPDLSRQLWERPKDITKVIDHLTQDPVLADRIRADRVYMAGHSLGGFTAALLAGARYDADKLQRFCAGAEGDLACSILAGWKIAQTAEDRSQMEADLSDQRIRAFALFDLGGTQSFSTESLVAISRPLLVFGAPIMNSGLTLDRESRALAKAVPSGLVQYVEPEKLSHFDFLGQCKEGSRVLIAQRDPGDEIICDQGGPARAALQDQIIDHVSRFFQQR
ncbi:alpha/beta hydrolase family protein [Rhodovibrionaceae bacterium A322]